MIETKLLNSNILNVLSKMGHTDMLTIGDAGLPIPKNVERIDLALSKNLPYFLDTLKATLSAMRIEKIILAEEIKQNNVQVLKGIKSILKDYREARHIITIDILFVSHEEFKNITHDSKAVIRTGECTPYANIILCSGVVF